VWACPADGRPLERGGLGLLCASCGTEVSCRDGVAQFSSGARDAGASLDESARRRGHRRQFATDWKFLLPLSGTTRVLEVGAGFGDDTLELSRRVACVYSLVPDVRNGDLVVRRLREHGAGNVAVGVVASLERIPLPPASIDAIALEDVAASSFGLTRQTFAGVAAEFARVLTPSGSIVIGARSFYRSVPGLAALLPPGTCESLNRIVKRAGRRGAGRLPSSVVTRRMCEAGFDRPQVYAPIPHEQRIEAVVPLGDPAALRYCFERFVRRNSLVARAGLTLARLVAERGLLPALIPYRFLVFRRA
jgi:SAM-dependent methyltransferase